METHLHHERHLQSSDMQTDVVIGMSDGLTIPFALAAGLSAVGMGDAESSTTLIIVAGLAATVIGSIAMGLGGYLTGKTEIDHYNSELAQEYQVVEQAPEKEQEEVREFFEHLGLSRDVQDKAVEEMTQDKQKWVDYMMKYELGLDTPDPKRARKSAFNIGISYIVGGIVPLSPYFFFRDDPGTSLIWSSVITLICLFIFGFFKSRLTGVNPWLGALRVTLIGAAAAGAAFGIARLIEGA